MNQPPLPKHPHLQDLLAVSDDPAPRKTRRIEWIGEQSPFDNPVIAWNMIQGNYTKLQMEAIRKAAARARVRVRRSRTAEHNHQYSVAACKGLHRTYHWTKENNYTCDVDYADVDIILGSDFGHEFVDLDAKEHDEPTILKPPMEIVVLQTSTVSPREAAVGNKVASH